MPNRKKAPKKNAAAAMVSDSIRTASPDITSKKPSQGVAKVSGEENKPTMNAATIEIKSKSNGQATIHVKRIKEPKAGKADSSSSSSVTQPAIKKVEKEKDTKIAKSTKIESGKMEKAEAAGSSTLPKPSRPSPKKIVPKADAKKKSTKESTLPPVANIRPPKRNASILATAKMDTIDYYPNEKRTKSRGPREPKSKKTE